MSELQDKEQITNRLNYIGCGRFSTVPSLVKMLVYDHCQHMYSQGMKFGHDEGR